MKHSNAPAFLLLLAIVAAPAFVLAQVESSPAPKPPKPDFSALAYREGTWTCNNVSSRRPAPFTTTISYAMDPDGYFMTATTTSKGTPWFPYPGTATDKFTYDPLVKRWVDIGYGTLGGYTYSVTTPASTPSKLVWHDMTGSTGDPSVSSSGDITDTKVSDNEFVSSSSFTEKSGRVVKFTVTCKKSAGA